MYKLLRVFFTSQFSRLTARFFSHHILLDTCILIYFFIGSHFHIGIEFHEISRHAPVHSDSLGHEGVGGGAGGGAVHADVEGLAVRVAAVQQRLRLREVLKALVICACSL